MGLFDFIKKKGGVDRPTAPPALGDLPPLTDLPPIDGSTLPSLDSFDTSAQSNPDVQSKFEDDMHQFPKQGSFNAELPSLDFTMPSNEDVLMEKRSQAMPSFPQQDFPSLNQQLSQQLNQQASIPTSNLGYIDLSEDINQLFFADKEWKEPDWNNFNPYPEPAIEPPEAEDFGIATEEPIAESEDSDLLSFEREERRRILPEGHVDVFVRGKDYVRVYEEMEKINSLLDNQEPQILTLFEDILHKEEEVLKKSKDTMEYVYKRLMVIDKRVFG